MYTGLLHETDSDHGCRRHFPADAGRDIWPRDLCCALLNRRRGKSFHSIQNFHSVFLVISLVRF